MPKRQFLQLCQTYVPNKYRLNGWLVSHKLDGMRAFWDGGLTRGMTTANVPWANVEKDKKDTIATGLWSRLGKVIYAPEDWLDQLPNMPLDGELYAGPGRFQYVMSVCKAFNGMSWEDIQYHVFDSPPYEVIFADGEIEVRVGNQKYLRQFKNIMEWIDNRRPKGRKLVVVNKGADFEQVLKALHKKEIENDIVKIVKQTRLPVQTNLISESVDDALKAALDEGVEGIVLRAHYESWRPIRADYILKYKPYTDDEGFVRGYVFGNGKYSGMMGAMIVEWKGKLFELSGFKDSERGLMSLEAPDDNDPYIYAQFIAGQFPGKRAPDNIINPTFPPGSVVTFRYNELSDNGIPTEGRFLRKC